MNASGVKYSQLKPDSVVSYVLRDEQHPSDPFRQWTGRVLRVNIGKPSLLNNVYVESLEPGYEGCCEYVLIEQIVSAEACGNLG